MKLRTRSTLHSDLSSHRIVPLQCQGFLSIQRAGYHFIVWSVPHVAKLMSCSCVKRLLSSTKFESAGSKRSFVLKCDILFEANIRNFSLGNEMPYMLFNWVIRLSGSNNSLKESATSWIFLGTWLKSESFISNTFNLAKGAKWISTKSPANELICNDVKDSPRSVRSGAFVNLWWLICNDFR